jgi:hypothetical protein
MAVRSLNSLDDGFAFRMMIPFTGSDLLDDQFYH